MKNRQAGCSQEISAAKAGISVRSGRRIEKGEKSTPEARTWRIGEVVAGEMGVHVQQAGHQRAVTQLNQLCVRGQGPG